MLILRRKIDERILIGPDVVVTVVRNTKGTVTLGIDAPREVEIQMGEVHDRIQRVEREGVMR